MRRSSGFTRAVDGQFSAPIVDPDDIHNLTAAFGINNSETVLGYFFGADDYHGFFLSGGAYTQYDVPDSSGTVLQGINNAGLGYSFYTDPAGTLKYPIAAPGSVSTYLYGINVRGWMVGKYYDHSRIGHGLLFIPPSQFLTFDYANSPVVTLTGINRKGFICGHCAIRISSLSWPPSRLETYLCRGGRAVNGHAIENHLICNRALCA